MSAPSLRDRIALTYTSAGSQREVARRLGITHQKVGRLLREEIAEGSRALKNPPDLDQRVANAYADHKRIVKAQAKKDGIPYRDATPVYQARLPPLPVTRPVIDPQTGEIIIDPRTGKARREPVIDPRTGLQQLRQSQRVQAPHLHWLSNDQRAAFVRSMHSTGKFAGVAVQSLLNLKAYYRQAEQRMRGVKRTSDQKRWRKEMRERIKAKEIQAASMMIEVYTKPVPMDFSADRVVKELNKQLRQKHEPASGDEFPGSELAKSILLQIDTRSNDEKPTAKKGTKKARKAR